MMDWEKRLESKVAELCAKAPQDSAHDLAHFKRVARTAKSLCAAEQANIDVVLPAAWLHDFVLVQKNDPRRAQASRLSAIEAINWLRGEGYPDRYLADIAHAIEAHSFSAKIEARTLEAKIVQDADRLDGIGAIGIARCFTVGSVLQRPLYEARDPFARVRPLDDGLYTLDHFYVKLFKTAETLITEAGRAEGRKRVATMKSFLTDLQRELGA